MGFDIRGGEHNGRYYVNLQAWRIHPADGSEGPPAAAVDVSALPEEEALALLNEISRFPDIVEQAYERYTPHTRAPHGAVRG